MLTLRCVAPHSRPSTRSICARLTPPSRRIAGVTPVTSTMVDSTPTRHGPPSSTTPTSAPRSARTCAAVVGLTRPKRLADGAATPPPNASSRLERERMIGHAHADRVAAAGHLRRRRAAGLRAHDDRERARPERVGESRARRRARRARARRAARRARRARSPDDPAGGPSPRRAGAPHPRSRRRHPTRRRSRSETRRARRHASTLSTATSS